MKNQKNSSTVSQSLLTLPTIKLQGRYSQFDNDAAPVTSYGTKDSSDQLRFLKRSRNNHTSIKQSPQMRTIDHNMSISKSLAIATEVKDKSRYAGRN